MEFENAKLLLRKAAEEAKRDIAKIDKAIEAKCKALYKQRKELEAKLIAYQEEEENIQDETITKNPRVTKPRQDQESRTVGDQSNE